MGESIEIHFNDKISICKRTNCDKKKEKIDEFFIMFNK